MRAIAGRADIPILLVIGRYEIAQGIAVRQMGNATFVLLPFSPQQLREKIEELTPLADDRRKDRE
jgi:DNA-binding response OmpR family regulator